MSLLVTDSVREEERRAREELARGCERDLLTIERFVRRPGSMACAELRDAMLSLGAEMDADLRKQLIAQAVDEIASRCARRAFSSADVRLRARFRNYADALVEAEKRASPGRHRRIVVPHLDAHCDRSVLPRTEPSTTTLDEWTADLRQLVVDALRDSIEAARRLVERRGREGVARDAIAVRLRQRPNRSEIETSRRR
ncbi:MAG: hypothetical protein ACREMP_10755 [Candidatus Tyrphobacter sp.]